jgi:acyl-CoA dehydrogenase
MVAFMREEVFPAEAAYERHRHQAGPDDHTVPPVLEELKLKARGRGLWNLFLPSESGLTQLEYAPIAELSGWSPSSPPSRSTARRPTPATWSCST